MKVNCSSLKKIVKAICTKSIKFSIPVLEYFSSTSLENLKRNHPIASPSLLLALNRLKSRKEHIWLCSFILTPAPATKMGAFEELLTISVQYMLLFKLVLGFNNKRFYESYLYQYGFLKIFLKIRKIICIKVLVELKTIFSRNFVFKTANMDFLAN